VIGYELSWLPWLYTHLYKIVFRLHHVEIYRQNFLTADLSSASLLVCYLFPEGMINLQQKLAGEHGANRYLISSTFALPAYTPVDTTRLNDLYNTPVYIYQLG